MLIGAGTTIKPGVVVAKPLPPVSYAVDSNIGIINEGDTMTFMVTTTAVPNGTVLYWTVENILNAPSSRFEAVSGSVVIAGGTASFGVTPLVNHHTDGFSGFLVYLRTVSTSGTVVAQSYIKQIADTSKSSGSGVFVNSDNDYLSIGAGNHFNLGTTWTIEWWQKTPRATTVSDLWTVMSQAPDNGRIDIFLQDGNLIVQNGTVVCAEPTPSGIPSDVANWNGGGGWNQGFYSNLATTGGTGTGLTVDVAAGGGGYINISAITINTTGTGYTDGDVITINNENNIPGTFTISVHPSQWTHVALVNAAGTTAVYYNGIAQTTSANLGSLSDTTDGLYIGRRGNNDFQYFNGKITNLRITDQALYNGNFTPDTLPSRIVSHTRLLWTPTDGALAVDSGDNALSITNNGVTFSTDYPPVIHRYTVQTPSNAIFTPNFVLVFTDDYPSAGTIPVGATAVIDGTTVTVTAVDTGQDFAGHAACFILTDGPGSPVSPNTSVTFTWYT